MLFTGLALGKPKMSAHCGKATGGRIKKNFGSVKMWFNVEQADPGQRCLPTCQMDPGMGRGRNATQVTLSGREGPRQPRVCGL